jgi:hypothetical protein
MIDRRTILKALAMLPCFAFLKPSNTISNEEILKKFPMHKISADYYSIPDTNDYNFEWKE